MVMNGCYYGVLNVLDPSVHYDSNGKIIAALRLPPDESQPPRNTTEETSQRNPSEFQDYDEGIRAEVTEAGDHYYNDEQHFNYDFGDQGDQESEALGVPMTVESEAQTTDKAEADMYEEKESTEEPISLFNEASDSDPEQPEESLDGESRGKPKAVTEIELKPQPLVLVTDFMEATPLFKTILRKNWHAVLFYLRTGSFSFSPLLGAVDMAVVAEHVQTWVIKKDINGHELWRQLPLHAAICYGAPKNVIDKLIEAYPDGLKCPDNFGNLPLHLAFIFEADDHVTACLMKAFPSSLHVMNYEGLQPIQCSNEICSQTFQSKAELFGALSDYTRAVAENDPDKLVEQLQDVRRQLKAVNDTLFSTAPPRKPEAIKEYLSISQPLPPELTAGNNMVVQYGPGAFIREITSGLCAAGAVDCSDLRRAAPDDDTTTVPKEAPAEEMVQKEVPTEEIAPTATTPAPLSEHAQPAPVAPVPAPAPAPAVANPLVVQPRACRVMEYCPKTKTWREV